MSDYAAGTTVRVYGISMNFEDNVLQQCQVQYTLVLPSGTEIDSMNNAVILPTDPNRSNGTAEVLGFDPASASTLKSALVGAISASLGLS